MQIALVNRGKLNALILGSDSLVYHVGLVETVGDLW